MDSATTGWMTRHHINAVHRADRFVTSFRAAFNRDATGSEERNGEDRAESKIKGGDSLRAAFPGLHIGRRDTRRVEGRAASLRNPRSCQQLSRVVFAWLRPTLLEYSDE